MLSHSDKNVRTRFGWVQFSILGLLWETEMYGLEILEHLHLKGHKISSSQLYPALNKLEGEGLLGSYNEQRVGADRKVYKTTAEGKDQIRWYIVGFLDLFSHIIANQMAFVAEDILSSISFDMGPYRLVDFSSSVGESILKPLAIAIRPYGQYFLTSPNKTVRNLYENQIDHYDLRDVCLVAEVNEESKLTTIKDSSVDICLSIFGMHEEGGEWFLPEMRRILKKNGLFVIADLEAIRGNAFLDLLVEFIPQHKMFGLDLDLARKLINTNGLKIVEERNNKGIHYFIGKMA